MCTRRQAIKYIVDRKQGRIDDLKNKLGNLYEPFVTMGFVEVRIKSSASTPKSTSLVEWVSTDRAHEQQEFYDLIP